MSKIFNSTIAALTKLASIAVIATEKKGIRNSSRYISSFGWHEHQIKGKARICEFSK